MSNYDTELISVDSSFNVINFLKDLFAKLNFTAGRLSLKSVRICENDLIFTKCTIKEFKRLGNELLNNLTIAIEKRIKIINNPEERKNLIELNHNNHIFGGHIGKKRLYAKLRQYYKWPNMARDVATYVKSCEQCQKNKVTTHTKIPMCITDTPQRSFDKISIDTIGPLPTTANGNKYAITVNCNLSKFFIPISIKNKEAKTIAEAIVENVFLIFGMCKEILTDMGTEYMNNIFTEIMKILKINHITSTPYRPQTMGGIERSHRTLNEYLRNYLSINNSEWDTYLKYFAYCYNTTPNSSFDCKFTPYELIFGKNATPLETLASAKIDPLYNLDDYSKEFRYKLQLSNKLARELLIKSKENNKKYYDVNINNPVFNIGDKILIIANKKHKLDSVYEGPYKIIDLDDFNVTIKNNKNKIKTIHKNRIIKFIR